MSRVSYDNRIVPAVLKKNKLSTKKLIEGT